MHYVKIPQLQTFVSFAAVRRRYETICKYTESIRHFLNTVKHFLSDDGTANADLRFVREWEREMENEHTQLRATWESTKYKKT